MLIFISFDSERNLYMPALPLSDYAMIGDCRTAAFVSRAGSIDWLCLPDFGSPSLFAKLLDDEKGGFFSITLENITHTARHYITDTAILQTTLSNAEGSIRITDCMPVLPDVRHNKELQPLREIIRHVEIISGTPTLLMQIDARPSYATRKKNFRRRGKLGWALAYHQHLLNLITDFPVTQHTDTLNGQKQTQPGDQFWFSLTYEHNTPGIFVPIGKESQQRIDVTRQWWQRWATKCKYEGAWRAQVVRSAITLRLLTFTQSGALLAAATTSLPERPQGWMNWDYRYCWPRDSAVTSSAFMHIGLHDEADAFFDWLMTAANTTRPYISNIYDVYGRSDIREKLLPWFAGYNGAKPVRIGNAVTDQLQHDVYGEVMLAVENWVQYFGKLDATKRELVEGFGNVMAKSWRKPDNGIWEIRDERRHYTYSKVMAWYVFDSLVRLHEKGYINGPVELYRRERDELRELIETRGFNKERNCYVAVLDGDTLDASLLLLPRFGFVKYDDPRMLGTWDAVQSDLEVNGYILRYPPGFGGSQPGEGSFIICNNWAVTYLIGSGKLKEAQERFKRLAALANDVGLYNESFDVDTREALGNMPQAFSHASFIIAATRMEQQTAQRKAA